MQYNGKSHIFRQMMTFWNNLPAHIDPIALQIGNFGIRWYSLCYLAAFLTIYLLLLWRLRNDQQIKDQYSHLAKKGFLEELFIFSLFGMLVGAKLGYIFFYDLDNFFSNPLASLFSLETGSFPGLFGFSYHGGLIGIVIAGILFCKKYKLSFLEITDFVIPAIPLGYMWGRLGNFLNGELFGRNTDVPWGMYFPGDQQGTLRHPSQLYEAFFEGIVLFLVLWPLRNKRALQGKLLGLYLIGYGIFRFCIEFFRQPDPQLGMVIIGLTMGQLLCFGMIVVGLTLLTKRR